MIIIRRGFDIDLNASTGEYVWLNAGTLYDDNAVKVYAPDRKSFKKIPNSKKFIYYNVITSKFEQYDAEIEPVDLDSYYQHLLPLYYIEVNAYFALTKYLKMSYDGFNIIPPPDNTDDGSVSLYGKVEFITETPLTIYGKNITLTHTPIQLFNLFIYNMGDVILGTITQNGKVLTLAEDVSPATCEVTYAYVP